MPTELIRAVDQYADRELEDAVKYDNRTPLDETGIYGLHRLAEGVYAQGYADGVRAEQTRIDGAERRRRDVLRQAEAARSAEYAEAVERIASEHEAALKKVAERIRAILDSPDPPDVLKLETLAAELDPEGDAE